jgi:hypothetical protein
MRHRRSAVPALALASVLVGACTSAASTPAPTSAPTATTAPPASTPGPTTASRPVGLGFAGRDAIVVVGRQDDKALSAIQASNGELMALLPDGAPTGPAWGSLATATVAADGATTKVADVIVQPGGDEMAIELDGAWALPVIGYDPARVGLSADGHTLVLVPVGSAEPDRATSRFAIVPFPPIRGGPAFEPKILELAGVYDYDAISPDGKVLYVVEHLDAAGDGAYQVRAVDLPSGAMRPDPITDKRNIGEAMAGWPVAQLRVPTGLVLTLYRGADHPFIHALMSTEGWAICIDLPAGDDAAAQADWGLAASADWKRIVAVNATRRLAVDIDPSELVARRTVTLATASGPTFELAKFGHIDGGPVGRRVVASPDGSRVFAASSDGVLRLAAPELSVDGRLLEGTRIESIGLLPDGRTLFALTGDGRLLAVDAATGELVGEVPGGSYDRLVAVVPWE